MEKVLMIEAKVIEDSISPTGKRITTIQVKFHRFILPEFNTHRVFSRNFSSSRAIPTAKLIEQVRTDPATPVHWGKNQRGMQANQQLDPADLYTAHRMWRAAANSAANYADSLAAIGAHKQIVNRIIEPFMWANGIVTSTEWDNWFQLRAHEDAQPEIQQLALQMRQAIDESIPRLLQHGQWHLPYVTDAERNQADCDMLKKISAARCCRVSYLKHDGHAPNRDDDLALFDRLAGAVPIHASPLEHQATPLVDDSDVDLQGTFKGWIQFRKVWEREIYTAPTNQQ
jgi:hypothetical protein